MAASPMGKRRDLNEVVREELPRLYRIAYRLTESTAEAEDLVAQTLMQAATGWEKFDGRFPVAWLIRILNNSFLMSLRSKGPVQTVPLEAVAEAEDPASAEAEVESRWTLEQVLKALGRLSAEHRMAITLCDIEQFPYEAAAEALGIPSGTVCSRLYRARKALQHACLGTMDDIR